MPGLPQPWTPAQRGVLIALVLGLALYAGVRYALNPMHVSNPQPLVPPRASELADRIDPNTADLDSLAALPLIGERRARDIVAYRERFVADHPSEAAFKKPDDLLRIRGIGASMVDQLKPYLLFPPATQPATSNRATSEPSS
jgi:competence protein ComEA